MKFDPFPVLETERLILRKMSRDDRDDFFAMRSDKRMHVYTDTMPDHDISETDEYLAKMLRGVDENRWIIWAIQHRASARVIGSVGIWNFNETQTMAELSYGIAPEFQGRGYMGEALTQVIEYAFGTLNLASLEAYTEQENASSRKLLQHLQFIEAGKVDDRSEDGTRVYQMIRYRLDRQTVFMEK
ncbi:MAG: N-acetyltransferase [Clostridiales bacterium]|nr:N-acetyltransferase [Clostridiales bacterium]